MKVSELVKCIDPNVKYIIHKNNKFIWVGSRDDEYQDNFIEKYGDSKVDNIIPKVDKAGKIYIEINLKD